MLGHLRLPKMALRPIAVNMLAGFIFSAATGSIAAHQEQCVMRLGAMRDAIGVCSGILQ